MDLLNPLKGSDFGAISLTERSCVTPISKVEKLIHTITDNLSCRT